MVRTEAVCYFLVKRTDPALKAYKASILMVYGRSFPLSFSLLINVVLFAVFSLVIN